MGRKHRGHEASHKVPDFLKSDVVAAFEWEATTEALELSGKQ